MQPDCSDREKTFLVDNGVASVINISVFALSGKTAMRNEMLHTVCVHTGVFVESRIMHYEDCKRIEMNWSSKLPQHLKLCIMWDYA